MSFRRPSAARWRRGIALCALLAAAISAPTYAQLPTATTVIGGIKAGWNLGNTLEAQCGETAWGNPMVTQQLINSVKAAGFNAIRIPAAWNCHVTSGTTIDPTWMARVKTVADYAYNSGMYVIINIHWDGGWLQDHPTFDFQTANNQKQQAFWTQIANTFKTYNERMMFAGTNEVHADYNEPTSEHITVQQSYNQTFVNAVRATGGNNATRTLIVQTYNTNAWHGLHYFTMPTDSAANRLVVEIHHYDPYDYTLNTSGPCLAWGAQFTQYSQCAWAQESYHTDLFSQVRAKWVANGIPVIIGEFGVGRRPNIDEASRQYYLEFVTKTATSNGMKVFYWDNGVQLGSGGEVMGMFNRSTGAVTDTNGLNSIMKGVGATSSSFALTLSKSGTGSGTVTSSPSGINCGSTCNASFNSGTSVSLTAAAANGSTFGGWGGSCSGTATTCTVSMTAARSVTATFNSNTATFALSVTKAGSGSGTVTSNTGGINCGSTCSANIASGTSVTLTASAASGSSFTGWSGACSGTGTCTVTMSAARAVTATFNTASTFALGVTRAGTGSGTVTSSPSGINCGSTCTANYASGTSVTLSQSAASGSTFAGWSGSCTGTGSCVLSMTAARSVTATFNTSGGGTGGTCANPITFSGNTGNFNTTGAVCYRTNATINGWGCSNFDGRTLTVGGVARTCGQLPLTKSSDGYYYFSVTAGTFAWASLYYW
ncbi:MAG TPA: cellulase family glycosylhydrolase [Povalibacter sp.]|nr:cellulase family glycosylhydrolase [Povalibacter sp.]